MEAKKEKERAKKQVSFSGSYEMGLYRKVEEMGDFSKVVKYILAAYFDGPRFGSGPAPSSPAPQSEPEPEKPKRKKGAAAAVKKAGGSLFQ